MADTCIFCEIAAGRAPAEIVAEWPETLILVPLKPVTPGHLLVIPKEHVRDFTTDPWISARTMSRAAEHAGLAHRAMNVITSRGAAATQSVFHLHLHLVPRVKDDGLALPWYSGKGGHQ